MDRESWFRTDEREDVIGSLEHVALCLALTPHHAPIWKWALLAAHSAALGALVCHNNDSAQIGSLDKPSQARVLTWIEERRKNAKAPYPRERLADLMDLLHRSFSRERHGRNGPRLTMGYRDVRLLLWLHHRRNSFMHFKPTMLILPVEDLPQVIGVAAAVAAAIMRGRNVSMFLETGQIERIDRALRSIEQNTSVVLSTLGVKLVDG